MAINVKSNSSGSLGSGKRRGNVAGEGEGSGNGEQRVRFREVREEERVLERSVVVISRDGDQLEEMDNDEEDNGFRHHKSSSCCTFANRWKRKKKKPGCCVM